MITQKVIQITESQDFHDYLGDLVFELCEIDTTPQSDVAAMRDRENAVFSVIERELRDFRFPGAYIERRALNPKIEEHPAFTPLYYTRTPERPEGRSPEEAFADRHNLLFILAGGNGGEGQSLALNAHIDVVAPFFSPRLEAGSVYGRGACDDKGQVVAIIAALKVLSQLLEELNLSLKRNLVCMFVVEEETGGNGSLSLAIDRDLKRFYDSMLVFETAQNGIYPANRGAVWYQIELDCGGRSDNDSKINLLEMACSIVDQLEIEGRAIKAESRHPLFPERPVQTCHGIIGPFGEHPSRICGEVQFEIHWDKIPDDSMQSLIADILDSALHSYRSLYGDKTKAIDPETGNRKVDRHYDLQVTGTKSIVSVHGATGHMGSILENDGAITKMTYLVRGLVASRSKIEYLGYSFELALAGHEDSGHLDMEGGQGFVPTHNIKEIMQRLELAVLRGVRGYLSLTDRQDEASSLARTSFDKLHNNAFAGSPDSQTVSCAIEAAKACGMWEEQELRGLPVSCDARLFADEYPEMPVLTSGPGHLTYAHSDEEHIDLEELRKSVAFLCLFILRLTETISSEDLKSADTG